MTTTNRIATKYIENVLDDDSATALYMHLKDNIAWSDGVRTRNGGFTRKAFLIEPTYLEYYQEVKHAIIKAIHAMEIVTEPITVGLIYLNYYRDGNDYTPLHSHADSKQLVISLGHPRTLSIGKKFIRMKNGSAVIFGSSTHGVPKETEITDGRISIAVFIKK